MGKLLLILVFVIAAILAIYLLTTYDKTKIIPDVVGDKHMKLQARNVGEYALSYATALTSWPGVGTIEAHGASGIDSVYNDFVVFENGTIDTINWTDIDPDSMGFLIKIKADVTWNELNKSYNHESNALIRVVVDQLYTDLYGFNTTGGITYKANGEIIGTVRDSLDIVFYDIFKRPKTDFIDEAKEYNSYYEYHVNYENMNDIAPIKTTWIEGDAQTTNRWPALNYWNTHDPCLLIVNGDFKATGQITFYGLLIVLGEFEMSADSYVTGGVIVLGDDDCQIKAQANFTQNDSIVTQLLKDKTKQFSTTKYWRE